MRRPLYCQRRAAQGVPLSDPQIGDVLIFGRTGAYSCMEGMSLFLSRDLPQVALCSARTAPSGAGGGSHRSLERGTLI